MPKKTTKKVSLKEQFRLDLIEGTEYKILKLEFQNAYLATPAGQAQKGNEIANDLIAQNEKQLVDLKSELEFAKNYK